MLLQKSRSLQVTSTNGIFVVLSPIEFNDQFCPAAIKIQYKSLKGVLPTKTKSCKLLASQTEPEQLLGIRHSLSQCTCRVKKPCGHRNKFSFIHGFLLRPNQSIAGFLFQTIFSSKPELHLPLPEHPLVPEPDGELFLVEEFQKRDHELPGEPGQLPKIARRHLPLFL